MSIYIPNCGQAHDESTQTLHTVMKTTQTNTVIKLITQYIVKSHERLGMWNCKCKLNARKKLFIWE